jgi:hypothetical protein
MPWVSPGKATSSVVRLTNNLRSVQQSGTAPGDATTLDSCRELLCVPPPASTSPRGSRKTRACSVHRTQRELESKPLSHLARRGNAHDIRTQSHVLCQRGASTLSVSFTPAPDNATGADLVMIEVRAGRRLSARPERLAGSERRDDRCSATTSGRRRRGGREPSGQVGGDDHPSVARESGEEHPRGVALGACGEPLLERCSGGAEQKLAGVGHISGEHEDLGVALPGGSGDHVPVDELDVGPAELREPPRSGRVDRGELAHFQHPCAAGGVRHLAPAQSAAAPTPVSRDLGGTDLRGEPVAPTKQPTVVENSTLSSLMLRRGCPGDDDVRRRLRALPREARGAGPSFEPSTSAWSECR